MKQVNIDFRGSVTELVSFLQETFSNPDGITLQISGRVILVGSEAIGIANTLRCPDMAPKIADRLDHFKSMVKDEHRIQAIKELRDLTGCLLEDAKKAIEGLKGTS